jgi:hypothetical protein
MMSDAKQPRANARENDPKFAKFQELYIETGNAYDSAKAAGYSEVYAKSHAHKLAARVRVKMGVALAAVGVDRVSLARRLARKLDATTVKWNPNKVVRPAVKASKQQPELPELRGGWDTFEDTQAQLRATEMALELTDSYPAKRFGGPGGPGGGDPIPIIIQSSIQRPRSNR